MITYKITLSDGKRVDVKGYDAGSAMAKALEIYRGRKITKCISGDQEWHKDSLLINFRPGWIEYEIPAHQAIPEAGKEPEDAATPSEETAAFGFLESVPVREMATSKRKSKK